MATTFPTQCCDLSPVLAYLDGDRDASDIDATAGHIDASRPCTEGLADLARRLLRLERAVQSAVLNVSVAPPGLVQRIESTIELIERQLRADSEAA